MGNSAFFPCFFLGYHQMASFSFWLTVLHLLCQGRNGTRSPGNSSLPKTPMDSSVTPVVISERLVWLWATMAVGNTFQWLPPGSSCLSNHLTVVSLLGLRSSFWVILGPDKIACSSKASYSRGAAGSHFRGLKHKWEDTWTLSSW